MKKKRRSRAGNVVSIILMVAAFCVFVGAAYVLYGFYRDYKKVDDLYASLEDYAGDDAEERDAREKDAENGQDDNGAGTKEVQWNGEVLTLPVMENPIDFASLEEVNEDLVGWLKVPALDLSYPVVQGKDNDYYLHNSFEKEELFSGCLFVNYENKGDFTDKNTIIYGHNMRSGAMFGSLKQFLNEDVYNKSKYFWIYTKDIIFLYRIISVREVPNDSEVYQYAFANKKEFQSFLDKAMKDSEVDNSTVSVTTDDYIVTLSTCSTYSTSKFVVQGKLARMYALE